MRSKHCKPTQAAHAQLRAAAARPAIAALPGCWCASASYTIVKRLDSACLKHMKQHCCCWKSNVSTGAWPRHQAPRAGRPYARLQALSREKRAYRFQQQQCSNHPQLTQAIASCHEHTPAPQDQAQRTTNKVSTTDPTLAHKAQAAQQARRLHCPPGTSNMRCSTCGCCCAAT